MVLGCQHPDSFGWIPGIGDAIKGGARVGLRLGTEVVEEGAERLVKVAAEEGAQAVTRSGGVIPSRAPDPTATPQGRRTQSSANDSADRVRSDVRENEAADTLARNGYEIEQNPSVPGQKRPDYRIEGEIFDNIAAVTDKPRNIWDRANKKILEEQTQRIVLNLDDSALDIEVLRAQFANWPIEGLQEVLVVRSGQVIPLYP